MNPYPICIYFPFASVYLFKDRTLVDMTPPMQPMFSTHSSDSDVYHHHIHTANIKRTKAHLHEYVKDIILTKAYDATILYHARSRTFSNSGRPSTDFGQRKRVLVMNKPFTSPSLQLVDTLEVI